jgi:protein SCO1/2
VRPLSLAAFALVTAVPLAAQPAGPGPAAPGVVASARPPILTEVSIAQRLDSRLPLELPFRDEGGRRVRLGDYFRGRPVVLSLVYYECPMLCTQVLNGLASSISALSFDVGREFEVVTVSFDPRETPALAAAKKRTYVRRYGRPGGEGGWHFLTGEPAAIAALTEAVGFRYAFDEKSGQFAHASAIFVATPDGRLARYLYGIEYAPRDLRLALVEASAGRIGSVVDEVLLYCFHYDAAAGRYGAVVLNVIRLGGGVTLALLAAFLTVSLRRERRARRGGAPAEPR